MIVDNKAFLSAIQNIINSLPKALDNGMNELAVAGTVHAKNTTLYKGTALRKETKFINDGFLAKRILADKDYAYWVEFGNNQKGSRIYPTRAKFLRFEIDGKVIFAKSVRSHGKLPFMNEAREYMLSIGQNIIESSIERILRG